MFTVPEGLPAPRSMPLAPRRTSTWSRVAVSGWMKLPPPAPWATVAPSNWMASMENPRE